MMSIQYSYLNTSQKTQIARKEENQACETVLLGRSASLLEFSRRNARSAVRQLACFIAEVAPVLISIYTVVDVALSQNAGSR